MSLGSYGSNARSGWHRKSVASAVGGAGGSGRGFDRDGVPGRDAITGIIGDGGRGTSTAPGEAKGEAKGDA